MSAGGPLLPEPLTLEALQTLIDFRVEGKLAKFNERLAEVEKRTAPRGVPELTITPRHSCIEVVLAHDGRRSTMVRIPADRFAELRDAMRFVETGVR